MLICRSLVESDATNSEWQRDLSFSHNRIGAVLLRQGNLTAALESHGKGLEIAQRLAQLDLSNVEWQRDWAISLGTLALARSRAAVPR